ncbi:MAG: tetratricopeptide repeat protein [Desulfuromonadales bacterium]|nr:tetratricopeptide repeat protein [Desulfuromonadales bacterium]
MRIFCGLKYLVRLIGLMILITMVAGCVFSKTVRHSAPSSPPMLSAYESQLADPAAKALFAFSQFRLLGGENRWDEAIAALVRASEFDTQSEYLRLILAKAYLHTEQPDKSVQTLLDLVKRFPLNSEAHQLLGDVFSYQQNFTQAVDQFHLALGLNPDDEQLQMRMALALARLERKDEAIDVLENLLRRHPGAVGARLSLARFYVDKGLNQPALEAYQQILEQQPGNQAAVLEYGKMLEDEDPGSAVELYHEALNHSPNATAISQRLAQLYMTQQRFAEALDQFRLVRRQFPDNQQIIARCAFLQLELQHWSEAEADFRMLLEHAAADDENRYYLAIALAGQDKFSEAIESLKQLTKTSEIYPQAVLQLAYLHGRVGRADEAVEVLKQALHDSIQQPDIYYYLAAFLGDRNDYRQALEYTTAGVQFFPEDVRLRYQLGIIQEKLGDRNAAVASMEKILKVDPDHADALNFLAYHQAEKGLDLELALTRVQKALELNPSGYIVDTLGWVLFKMGRLAESRVQLEDAAQLHPEDAVIAEHLGDLYREMKLWRKARDSYRRSLELDPTATHVQEKLDQLPAEEQP